MGTTDLLVHLLSFFGPAVAVGLGVALAGPLLGSRVPRRRPWWVQGAINFVAGGAVLGAGLWYWGVDGKMATYAALVAVVGTCQWLFSAAWRA